MILTGDCILMHGDCLEKIQKIPDKSVDLVLTDPPYGVTSCKWDTVIPFDPMWEQLNRVIKDMAAVVLFGSEPFSSALRMSNIKNYKYDWVWEKEQGTNFQLARVQPLKVHENICVFYASQSKYKPQGVTSCDIIKSNNGKKGKLFASGFKRNEYIQTQKGYPRTILRFFRDRGLHPTQKPVELMEYLIKTYTNKGETVLDFTMGSGTTGVACKQTGRKFIGIELDDKYFEISEKRIKQAVFQMEIF